MIELQEIINWRHYLHQYPEFGFQEIKTSAWIVAQLNAMGIVVHKNIGKTGVVGILKNGTSDCSIGLRADMDALKIEEQNELSYASKHDGYMHACGHDGHTTMLLAAAKELASKRNFDGTIYFIFQPAEEHGLGARAMIDDGLFSRWKIDAVYGMHNLPGLAAGNFATKPGYIMASESNFEITIIGTGGHAATPHLLTDPLVVGAQIVTALQTIVSRTLSVVAETAVVSVTEFITNGTVNVIPSEVKIKGDIRCYTDDTLEKINKTMERIIAGLCQAAGVEYQFEYSTSFIPTINTPVETDIAIKAATKVAGAEQTNGNCFPITVSEDFAYMLGKKKGCFIFIGNGNDAQGCIPLHNPCYNFNDAILAKGAAYWVTLVEDVLGVVE